MTTSSQEKKIITSCLTFGQIAFCFFPSAEFSQASLPSTAELDPLTEKVFIAIVSAVLSLITGYVLLQIKERREPRKRLSYDLETRHNLVTVEENISRNVSLMYKGLSTEKLSYVRCDVKNTGNSVIKSEYLRFEFADGSRILDAYTEPPPPKEYGVSEVEEAGLRQHERRYLISHLEKQQQVGFRFVLTDMAELEPKIIPFNEEGDVEVVVASISRAADDRRFLGQFVYLFVLSLIIQPIFRFLPGSLGDIALAIVSIIFGVAMLPLLKPVSRTLAGAIIALDRPKQEVVSIANVHQEESAILSISGKGDSVLKVVRDGAQLQ